MFRLARALPVGLFDNEPIRAYLHRIFTMKCRTDDFRALDRRLLVIAADLDSGAAIRFGEPGRDEVPISRAVQASCALPGVYPPVNIDDRYYVDGVLLKTLHASVALDSGVDLLIAVNPIVPVDTDGAVAAGVMRRGKLVHRGLPTVLSQTFRTLVHSRLAAVLGSYAARYPDRDVLLIEPSRDDYRMFFTNIFSFSQRRAVCEHAYRSTRKFLLDRRESLEPVLARYGIHYREQALREADRDLWRQLGADGAGPGAALVRRLDDALERLDELLEEHTGAASG
jgi:predicted acylesterase/phospholipase RssA